MEPAKPDGPSGNAEVIDIADSDDDGPVLSQSGPSVHSKTPLPSQETSSIAQARHQQNSMNGNRSIGAENIRRWRDSSLQVSKQESKKAWRSQWHHIERTFEDWYQRCLTLQSENDGLKVSVDKLQSRLLSTALTDLQIKDVDRKNLELQEKCKALEEQLKGYRENTSTQNDRILGLDTRIVAVAALNGAFNIPLREDGIDPAQTQLQLFQDALTKLTTAMSALPSETDGSIVEQLKTIHDNTTDRLRQYRQEATSMKSENEKKQAKIEELMNQLGLVNTQTAREPSKADKDTASKERDAITELETVRADLVDLKQKLEEANRQKHVLQAEIEAHEESKNEMDIEMLALRDQLRVVKKDLSWAENKAIRLEEDAIDVMEDSEQSVREAFRTQKQQIASLKQELAETRAELELHQDDEKDMTRENERLSEKLDNSKERLAEANVEIKKLKQRLKQVREETVAPALPHERRRLEEELARLNETNENLESKIKEKDSKINELKQKTFTLSAELEAAAMETIARSVTPSGTPSRLSISSTRKRGVDLDYSEDEWQEYAEQVLDKFFHKGGDSICSACRHQDKNRSLPTIAVKDRTYHILKHHVKHLEKLKKADGVSRIQKKLRTEAIEID